MQCDICKRSFNTRRKRFCASCARATLYPGRIAQAQSLLDREKSHAHVEALVRPGNDGVLAALPEDADWDGITAGLKTLNWERTKADIKLAENKIKDITEKAEKLSREIQDYKSYAEKQKEDNVQRRKILSTESSNLVKQRGGAMESAHEDVKKVRHRLGKVHRRTVEARDHLCREASSLSGLKKVKNEEGRSEYRLAGCLLPDFRDLNGLNGKIKIETIETPSGNSNLVEPHETISASLENICRFLGICCHYLSIRLPAELILPHNDFPHAAVLPRDSSYRTKNIRYPGSSQRNSPAASRILPKNDLSKPRLLQIDRLLPQLQKEDPKSALLFLEGVTFVAYDIAWLCRSQGMDSINSFADISAVGHNLYQLFAGKDSMTRPALNRNISAATTNTERLTTAAQDSRRQLGMYSHDSAEQSLVGYEGFALFNHEAWPVSVTRLTDHLKSYLRQETARAEWHFIDDTEWDEELEADKPVLIGGARRALDPAMSVLSVRPSDGTDEADVSNRERGTSGWTKLRGRGGEE